MMVDGVEGSQAAALDTRQQVVLHEAQSRERDWEHQLIMFPGK